MIKIYGFTHSRISGNVIGIGKKCFCFKIYWATKYHKLRIQHYTTSSRSILWNLKYNQSKFWILGMISIDSTVDEDLVESPNISDEQIKSARNIAFQ